MGKDANVPLARGLLSVLDLTRRSRDGAGTNPIVESAANAAAPRAPLSPRRQPRRRWFHAVSGRRNDGRGGVRLWRHPPNRHPQSLPSSTSTKTSKHGWPASLPTGASRTRHGCTRAGRFWRCAGPSSSGGGSGGAAQAARRVAAAIAGEGRHGAPSLLRLRRRCQRRCVRWP